MASERRLAEIRERLAAATPGPWELYATERNVIAITKGRTRGGYLREIVHWSGFDCSNIDDPGKVRANAALIAHAPSDLAYLLDEITRLTRELEAARAALTIAETTAANLHDTIRLRDRELAAARSHARRLCVALRAIRDEAAIGGPPLESRREDWEAAMDEADEVLGELEALYGE